MMTPKQTRYNKAGQKIVQALKSRKFDAYYCQTSKEAAEKILSLIPRTDVVSWGGSQTLQEIGVFPMLNEQQYRVLDRDRAKTPEERSAITRKALTCDTFLMSSNAVTQDGQLFNIDGAGNRLAAMIYGPKSVIVAVGMNKVVKTLADAESRARNYAAPMNCQRFDKKTPCCETGLCGDCRSDDSICTYLVATRLSNPKGRIKVILIGEDLGM
jgi:L-lactate utilization protein LutB